VVTLGQVSHLLAQILAAEDEADVVDLLVQDANELAELPPRERERANERIADAIRERRQLAEYIRRRQIGRSVASRRRRSD
jgi:acyl-CoA reductase-like NAD-dependent aldehyde dehydrogenase